MRESFQNLILHLVLTGIFLLCVTAFWFLTRRLFRQIRALSRLTRTVVVVMVTVAALLAQKPEDDDDGNDGDEGESGNYSLIEHTIQAYEPWTLRGAADDWFILNFTNNWVFPHNSNHWTRCVVLTSGQVWDTTRGTNRLVAVGQQMSAVPDESCFTYELTDDNSYLLTWSNFFLNRDTNKPITASIELKRNGDWIATSNEVSVSHSRLLPFAHNGFGQDADWVRANFTNAEEILSVGYADWVDAQVGYNLTNGLYKLTASFADVPPEAVNLTVGNYSVVVTNAGDYAFLLEKGVDYELSASADVADIDWWAVDDLAEPEPSLFVLGPLASPPAQWSEDSGFNFFWNGSYGLLNWLPTLRGSPDVAAHLSPDDFPMTFTATLSDCYDLDDVSFTWSGSPFLEIDADGATATVNANGLPSWGDFYLQVRADFGWHSLYSSLHTTCGTNSHPTVGLSISAPQVVFLNDDNRSTRHYRIQVTATCEVETNAVISLSQSGNVAFAAFTDSQGENATTITNVTVSIPAGERVTTHDFWFRCGRVSGGEFIATTDGGVTNTTSFNVIEPIQRLVTNAACEDGRLVNPSRLVVGTNAWLEVGCNGNFPAFGIVWRVVSGPARIVQTTGFRACVEPTADEGEAIIEARFGNDTDNQPRFVLPIVRPRIFPLRVYYVKDENHNFPDSFSSVTRYITEANNIFSQIGVFFQQIGEPQEIDDSSFAVLPEHALIRTPSGGEYLDTTGISAKAFELLGRVSHTNSVCVVCVPKIINGTSVAFTMAGWNTVVLGDVEKSEVLAHEFGHILGLEDIYARWPDDWERLMAGYYNTVRGAVFWDWTHDWCGEGGRGFYGARDVHGHIIERLLMNGYEDTPEGIRSIDIPSSGVFGYSSFPQNYHNKVFRHVGADSATKEAFQ